MRFYLTLVLYNLWRQKTIWQVAVKFQLPRGVVQSLLTAATAFASCVLHFCQVRSHTHTHTHTHTAVAPLLSGSYERVRSLAGPAVVRFHKCKEVFSSCVAGNTAILGTASLVRRVCQEAVLLPSGRSGSSSRGPGSQNGKFRFLCTISCKPCLCGTDNPWN